MQVSQQQFYKATAQPFLKYMVKKAVCTAHSRIMQEWNTNLQCELCRSIDGLNRLVATELTRWNYIPAEEQIQQLQSVLRKPGAAKITKLRSR